MRPKIPNIYNSLTELLLSLLFDSKPEVYRSSDRRDKTCAGRVRINVKSKTNGQKDGQTDRGPLLYFSYGLYIRSKTRNVLGDILVSSFSIL